MTHVVVFWLRPDVTPEDEEAFRAGLESLRAIPAVRALQWGRPAAVPPRPVVDASFSFLLAVQFDDVAGHNAYQDHPLHHAFLARCRSLWVTVRIYDAG